MGNLEKLRTDYGKSALTKQSAGKQPFELFEGWLQLAMEEKVQDANAMMVSSVDAAGFPQSRIVLLRYVKNEALYFFTNYDSNKAKELFLAGKAGVNFFWASLEKQIRLACTVTKSTDEESDAYFASRPRESQIGAWASLQSSELENRAVLEKRVADFTQQFEGKDVPRPKNWGGMVLKPISMEFWQGRNSRLHDRILFEKKGAEWDIKRLYP